MLKTSQCGGGKIRVRKEEGRGREREEEAKTVIKRVNATLNSNWLR